jgi:hypothetical protein
MDLSRKYFLIFSVEKKIASHCQILKSQKFDLRLFMALCFKIFSIFIHEKSDFKEVIVKCIYLKQNMILLKFPYYLIMFCSNF